MESILSFITKFTDVVKNQIEETNECLGKEVVNSKANKTGICVDKVKVAYGAKFSMLGLNYKDSEMKDIENFNEDVLVVQGNNGYFFVPVSSVQAFGGSVILVDGEINQPETTNSMARRKQEVFTKFSNTKRAIKDVMPKIEDAKSRRKKKKLGLFY
jgi:sporulation protein YlmC with PRC-barrel domain